MDEGEAAIAPLRHDGACVEGEVLDELDDVVIGHDAIVADPCPGFGPNRVKMPQPGLERRQGAFAATRFYRRDDPTSPLFLVRRGADGAVDHHRADGALPKLFHRAGLGPCWRSSPA